MGQNIELDLGRRKYLLLSHGAINSSMLTPSDTWATVRRLVLMPFPQLRIK